MRATLLLLCILSLPSPSQNDGAVKVWVQRSYEAMRAYRQGDVTKAFQLLEAMTAEEQAKAVREIRTQVERIAAGWPPRAEDVIPWPPANLRALAALHMEAALAARSAESAAQTVEHHTALGKDLFNIVYFLLKEDDRAAARWLLALGLEEMRNGEFAKASNILIPACTEYDTYAPLLVACGSLHDTLSLQPADRYVPVSVVMPRDLRMGGREATVLSRGVRGLNLAQAQRNRHLQFAREYLERAIKLDSSSNEAMLRLAYVRLRQRDEREASAMLEDLLKRPALDSRESYLARLVLARARDQQNRLDEAGALLGQAPQGQSVLLARAHNALRRGNASEAARLSAEAAALPADDSWWGYRFGQYWVPSTLFKELRAEARR